MGTLNVGSGGTATVSLSSLLFNPDPSSTPVGPPWNAEVASGTTLSFTGGPLNVTEGILINGGAPITSTPITSFMTFAAHPNLVFNLAAFGSGSSNTNCASVVSIGQSCSVFTGSPVVLTLTPTGTSVSFSLNGKASDTGVAGLATGSSYIGSFSTPLVTPLPNGASPTPANVQSYLCPNATASGCQPADFALNRSITSPFGGQFIASAIPEPAGMGLAGLVLMGLGYGLRRYRAQKA
jgi:hypothetical protein